MFHRFKLLLVTIGLGLAPLSAALSLLNVTHSQIATASELAQTPAKSPTKPPTKPPAKPVAKSPAATPKTAPPPAQQIPEKQGAAAISPVWLLVVLIPVGLAALHYLRRLANASASAQTRVDTAEIPVQPPLADPMADLSEPVTARSNSQAEPADRSSYESESIVTQTVSPALTPTTRLAKIDIVEVMVSDLHNSDAAKRRKAIWELGQQGDSRAIQPLVDLLVDSDSQQRSLVLAALSEISTRTLKPMHRALLLSLQDENADVRKNAIRDVTRVYDSMSQISQLLQYAASDTDSEVQETARWALSQLNRFRTVRIEQSHEANRPSLNGRELQDDEKPAPS